MKRAIFKEMLIKDTTLFFAANGDDAIILKIGTRRRYL